MSTSPIQLIVGLANPGKEYAETRHNAGAWFVEAIATEANTRLRFESKYQGLHSLIKLYHASCQLLIPMTFMNHSGQAVNACVRYFKIPPQVILIAHDDIDLPVGTIKLKFGGGDGGHNGLKDIIQHLQTREFYRLRIGIGRPARTKEVIDYVLRAPSNADKKKITDTLLQAQATLPLLLHGEMQKAMQQLHTQSEDE